jgi:K+-sensing histidine kinase KdpD
VSHPIEHFEKMKWQDKVFSIGEIVFLTGLIPSLLSSHKPAAATSLATAVMLYAFMFVHASYGLWVTFTLTAITATIWLALGIQVAAS